MVEVGLRMPMEVRQRDFVVGVCRVGVCLEYLGKGGTVCGWVYSRSKVLYRVV